MARDGLRRDDDRPWVRRVVAAAADALVERQVTGGGFGAGGWANAGRQEPSIASTAQALRVLRSSQRPHDEAWEAGQAFLRGAVVRLDASSLGDERHIRYWNHALIGLVLREPAQLEDGRVRAAQLAAVNVCLHRIVELSRRDGGWTAPDDVRLSPTKTSRTLVALSDARRRGWLDGPLADAAIESAARGADRLLALQRPDGSWPTNLSGRSGPPSPAATAIAAFALSRAARHGMTSQRARGAARRARDWLLINAATWITAAERDDWIANRTWIHPTYALGLRACLEVGASVLDRRLAPALHLLRTDYRSPREGGGWRERGGRIGGQVTVNATYNAVMALDAVQRAWARTDAFDALQALGALTPASADGVAIRLGPNFTIDAVTGDAVAPGPVVRRSTWRLLAVFAGYEDAAGHRGIATRVLADELGRTTDGSARAAVAVANAELRQWLGEIGAGGVAVVRHGFAYRLAVPVTMADTVDLGALR